MHEVFISYASADKAIADGLCHQLEQEGLRCWIAPRNIQAGADYGEAILHGIEQSKVLVLVLSSRSNQSKHTLREVERAVNKGLRIVPFRIEDVMPSKKLEYFLGTTHWLDAMTPPIEAHMKRLAAELNGILGNGPAPQPAPVPGPTPPPKPKTGLWIAFGAAIVLIAGGATAVYALGDPPPPTIAAPSSEMKPSSEKSAEKTPSAGNEPNASAADKAPGKSDPVRGDASAEQQKVAAQPPYGARVRTSIEEGGLAAALESFKDDEAIAEILAAIQDRELELEKLLGNPQKATNDRCPRVRQALVRRLSEEWRGSTIEHANAEKAFDVLLNLESGGESVEARLAADGAALLAAGEYDQLAFYCELLARFDDPPSRTGDRQKACARLQPAFGESLGKALSAADATGVLSKLRPIWPRTASWASGHDESEMRKLVANKVRAIARDSAAGTSKNTGEDVARLIVTGMIYEPDLIGLLTELLLAEAGTEAAGFGATVRDSLGGALDDHREAIARDLAGLVGQLGHERKITFDLAWAQDEAFEPGRPLARHRGTIQAYVLQLVARELRAGRFDALEQEDVARLEQLAQADSTNTLAESIRAGLRACVAKGNGVDSAVRVGLGIGVTLIGPEDGFGIDARGADQLSELLPLVEALAGPGSSEALQLQRRILARAREIISTGGGDPDVRFYVDLVFTRNWPEDSGDDLEGCATQVGQYLLKQRTWGDFVAWERMAGKPALEAVSRPHETVLALWREIQPRNVAGPIGVEVRFEGGADGLGSLVNGILGDYGFDEVNAGADATLTVTLKPTTKDYGAAPGKNVLRVQLDGTLGITAQRGDGRAVKRTWAEASFPGKANQPENFAGWLIGDMTPRLEEAANRRELAKTLLEAFR